MKRSLVLLLILSLVLSVVVMGCTSSDDQGADAEVTEDESNEKEVDEVKRIKDTIEAKVEEYSGTDIEKIDVNENLGTEDEDDLITLVHLKWNVQNKAETTKKMLEMYSDDLAATLAEEENITEITIFWEVPYHQEGDNIAKMNYTRSEDKMAIGERWYDPVIR